MPSLLVTNDFPPKVGGIQSYLWELWRRLPADQVTVLTSRYRGDREWDARQAFRIERAREWWLLPTRDLVDRIDELAREVSADVVILDPGLPLGIVGPRLRSAPYVVVVHGSEVTVPARLPGSAGVLRAVLDGAAGVLAAGGYPAAESARLVGHRIPSLVIPPGVDARRFVPSSDAARSELRKRLGWQPDRPVVVGVSRLVTRKGFDVLIDAVAGLDDEVGLVIAGAGRDRARLEARIRSRGIEHRARLLGRVSEAELPSVYAAGDVFAMPCRDRWRGLEQEGFGIVFLEAAAAGLASVAGRSGGTAEAVVEGETGFVVEPRDPGAVRDAIAALLADPALRMRMGAAARERAETTYSYDSLAERLAPLASGDLSVLA